MLNFALLTPGCGRMAGADRQPSKLELRMNISPVKRPRIAAYIPLPIVLLLAFALRLLLWGRIPRTGLISDEGEYLSAASWLAQGRSFSWYQNYLWTRAPIYPLFVAV